MIFSLNRKTLKLKKADLQEEKGAYRNPGRGWYHIYTFSPGCMRESELRYLPFEKDETIALVLINISRYRTGEIDGEGLALIEEILKCFVRAGKEMILRIVYDHEGKGMEKEPSLFSVVLKHMEQTGPIVRKYADDIMVIQGLFVGSWGEMHSSKFLSENHLRELTRTWRRATGDCVRMAFRRPVQCRQASAEGEPGIGFFDDAIFASGDHLGTFGQQPRNSAGWGEAWQMKDEIDFLKSSAANVPCGGEAVSGDICMSAEDTVNLLRNMNISYLNCVYDEKILGQWREQKYSREESLYQYIGNHLGYRFVVREVSFVKRKGFFLKILLENTGFGNLCDRAAFHLIIRNGGDEKIIAVPYDMRKLMPGEKEEISAQLGDRIERGSRFFLEIRRCKDKKSIRFANIQAGEQMLLGEIE